MTPVMPSVDFAECLQRSSGRQAHITTAFFCPFGLPNGNCVGNTVPGNRPVLTNCHGKNVHRCWQIYEYKELNEAWPEIVRERSVLSG